MSETPYHSKALPQGTILREWELEQVLGVGGFGIVYRGRGIHFNEMVAIKEYFPGAISDRTDGTTVAPTDSSSEEIYGLGLEKFLEEAKILWNLSKPDRHPNVVCVRSLFTIHGTAYMVMDFETGMSLSQLLKDGRRFDEESLLAIIKPVAEGLHRAHTAGVIHRDIKPANILVDDRGRPVLIDFGSARFDSGQATSTKVTFYTPPYAALEQYVKTYQQGPWTDIYALGVTMYQCVTGEKPPEVLERLHGGLGESLSAKPRPGYGRAFCRAVDAAMAIRPSERPQSIPQWLAMFDEPDVAVDDEVTRIHVAPPPDATVAAPMAKSEADLKPAAPAPAAAVPADGVEPDAPRKARWILPAAAAAVVLLGGAALVVLFWPSGPAKRPAKAAAPAIAAAPAAVAAPTAGVGADYTQYLAAVEQGAAGVIASARRIGRPASEVTALTGAQGQMGAVIAQIRAAGGADPAPLMAQLNTIAADMAKRESGALGRAAAPQAQEVRQTLGGASEARSAVALVSQTKQALDTANAGAAKSADASASITATGRSLAAYEAFAAAYASAKPYFAPAKRAEFAADAARTRAISGEVAALSTSVQRPGVFASQARKNAFKTLQDNAAAARTQAAQLDALSTQVSSMSDLGQIEAAAGQADGIRRSLNVLKDASSAAAQVVAAPN